MIFEEVMKVFRFLVFFCLAFLSIEILIRRWYWAQIPTQIPGIAVYGLLALNLYVVIRYLRPLRQP